MSDDEPSGPGHIAEAQSGIPPTGPTIQLRYQESPLPPVEQMRGFEEMMPGATNRFFNMLETSLAERHTERRALMQMMLRGQLLAFAVAIGALGAAFYCIATDRTVSAAAIVGALFGSGVVTTILARRQPPKH